MAIRWGRPAPPTSTTTAAKAQSKQEGTQSLNRGYPWSVWSGDQRGLHYWDPQGIFYIRSLLSRAGNITDLYIQKQRVRQNEDQRDIHSKQKKTTPHKHNGTKWTKEIYLVKSSK